MNTKSTSYIEEGGSPDSCQVVQNRDLRMQEAERDKPQMHRLWSRGGRPGFEFHNPRITNRGYTISSRLDREIREIEANLRGRAREMAIKYGNGEQTWTSKN